MAIREICSLYQVSIEIDGYNWNIVHVDRSAFLDMDVSRRQKGKGIDLVVIKQLKKLFLRAARRFPHRNDNC